MQEFIETAISFLKDLVYNNNPLIGLLLGMLIIVLESIIPILPLAVFIAVNMLVFGNIVGFIISWVATCLGCLLSFTIFRSCFSNLFYKHIKNKKRLSNLMDQLSKIRYQTLVIITALPFTPAFSINIAGGLSKISYKKFMAAIVVGKLSIVYFWGFIGSTFLESITNVKVLIELVLLIFVAYVISKIVSKKFKIE